MSESESKTEYTNNVRFNQFGGVIRVAIFDPERNDGAGGAKFGFAAEVTISDSSGSFANSGRFVATVSMSAIGSHTPEEAAQRIDVYSQAADIAYFFNQQIEHQPYENLVKWLTDALPERTSDGFVYKAWRS